MCLRIVNSLNSTNISFDMPSCNTDRINDHKHFLMKSVFESFLKIRLNHAAKLNTLDIAKDYIRSQCKKLPQFKNQ